MLEFKITINDDGRDAENQARAVVAGLVGFYGLGIIPQSYARVGELEVATGPVVINRYDGSAAAPAVDGFPSKPADLEPVDPQADAIGEDAPTPGGIQHVASMGTLDTAGIPWDERIHASTKTTNKDGTWTRRRNTSDETFDAVMAELKGTPVATPVIPAPPAEPTASEAFAAPAAPASVPTPPAPAATGDAPSFVDLMKKITTLQGAGKLTKPDLDGYLQSCGVEGVGKLATASADARSNVGAILDGLV